MIRNVDLNEITDGKFYEANDMVKLGVEDCAGCHACCCGTGATLNLDPYDIYRLEAGLGRGFKELLAKHLELRVADGVIMPFLRMDKALTVTSGETPVTEKEACTFLNDLGRCSIHDCRPGICRLFPLGRIYEGNGHKYILMENECHKERRVKVKIKKWLETPEFQRYEEYVDRWHHYVTQITDRAKEMPEEELKRKNMALLQLFYFLDYETSEDFYEQFYKRIGD